VPEPPIRFHQPAPRLFFVGVVLTMSPLAFWLIPVWAILCLVYTGFLCCVAALVRL
jgi:hypothetical protein